MNNTLVADLKKVGLEEKEAKVYVAALELGPSPVQKISLRAGVPRATTYLVLEELKDRGLITTFEKGKKTFFAAESPQQLNDLVEAKAIEIEYQQTLLKELIPDLVLRGQFEKSSRPVVKYYEGFKALKAFIRDMLAGIEKEVLGVFVHEDVQSILSRSNVQWDIVADIRKKEKIQRRIICIYRGEKPPIAEHPGEGVVFIPYKDFPLEADINIKGNRVGFMPYTEPVRGVIIEDSAISSSLRLMFEGIWKSRKSI